MCGLCFIYLTNSNKQFIKIMLTKYTTVLLTGPSFDALVLQFGLPLQCASLCDLCSAPAYVSSAVRQLMFFLVI